MSGLYKIHMGAAKCALDMGDGSERGEYVNQDYILNVLGRPHRAIGLMYTYYPKDKEWSEERISVTCKDMDIKFRWDYPYDDYFPYRGRGLWHPPVKWGLRPRLTPLQAFFEKKAWRKNYYYASANLSAPAVLQMWNAALLGLLLRISYKPQLSAL